MNDYYLISIDRATLYELDQVQDLIKTSAGNWWHRHETLWIVHGGNASKWRDLMQSVLRSHRFSVSVMQLPDKGSRNWCFSGNDPKAKCDWFHQNYL
jgi:hypothetical protein